MPIGGKQRADSHVDVRRYSNDRRHRTLGLADVRIHARAIVLAGHLLNFLVRNRGNSP